LTTQNDTTSIQLAYILLNVAKERHFNKMQTNEGIKAAIKQELPNNTLSTLQDALG